MSAQREPTNTAGLRNEFRVVLTKPFRALRSATRKTVGYTYDALELSEGQDGMLLAAADDISPSDGFVFTTEAEAQDEFLRWLDEQIDRGVLERIGRRDIRNGQHYTAPYIRSAYGRGIDHADAQLAAQGVSVPEQGLHDLFRFGAHEEQLQGLYTRAFLELEDITQEMQTEIRRELSRGFAEGHNPRRTARALTDRVDKIGITRAERLARTETLHAHNTAAASRYQEAGITHVKVLTYNPCDTCSGVAASGPYPISEAGGLVPDGTHPNCVCTIAPTAPPR